MTIDPTRLEELKTMPYAEYLQTPEWLERREKAVEQAKGRCQLCYSPDNLNAHHRTYERRGNEDPADLTVLCQPCHEAHHLRMAFPESAFTSIIDGIPLAFEEFTATFEGKHLNIPTGFTDLDRLGVCFKRGELTVIAGRPKLGKSTLARTLALNVSKHGKQVAFVSLEQNQEELTKTFISMLSRVPLVNLDTGRIADDEWERLITNQASYIDLKIQLGNEAIGTIDELCGHLNLLQQNREKRVDLLILDRLDLLELDRSGRKDFPEQRARAIARQLKLLARQIRLPIVATIQLSGAIENSLQKVPSLSLLKGVDADADTVLLLHRDDIFNPDSQRRRILDVMLPKSRAGMLGEVVLYSDDYYGIIRELEKTPHTETTKEQ